MKEVNNKSLDFLAGERVAYVPMHAHGDLEHSDVEHGEVNTSNDLYVFVKFDKNVKDLGWDGATSQSCRPEDLVKI